MNKLFLSISILFFAVISNAQDKYFTKTGKINFDATATNSPEQIVAINKSTTCVLDVKTGVVAFSLLMKGFEFERALMGEHFNENYVESSKFPKAEFKGAISDNAAVNYAKDGTYNAIVKGKLTMHGETKDVETPGTIKVSGGKIMVSATFSVLLDEYKVSVPKVVADKVSKTAKIKVECLLEPLKK